MAERLEISFKDEGALTRDDKIADMKSRSHARANRDTRAAQKEQRSQNQEARAQAKFDAWQQDREQKAEEKIRRQAHKARVAQEKAEQKANRERLKEIAAEEQAESQLHVTRRRFINDLFGAFNNAHLGRRINHFVEFIRSMGSGKVGDSIQSAANTASRASNTVSNVNSASNVANTVANTTNAARNVSNNVANNNSTSSPTTQTNSSSSSSTTRNVANVVNIGSVFSRVISSSGKVVAKVVKFVAALPFAKVIAVIALVVLALTSFVVVTKVIINTFKALHRTANNFRNTLAKFPGPLMFVRLNNQLNMFSRRLNQAREFGGVLAAIENETGKQDLLRENMKETFMDPFLYVQLEANEILTKLLKIADNISNLFMQLGGNQILGLLERMLNGIGRLIDVSEASFTFFKTVVNQWWPLAGAAIDTLEAIVQVNKKNQFKGFDKVAEQMVDFLGIPTPQNVQDVTFDIGI
jgi:hypothetical protein